MEGDRSPPTPVRQRRWRVVEDALGQEIKKNNGNLIIWPLTKKSLTGEAPHKPKERGSGEQAEALPPPACRRRWRVVRSALGG